MIVPLLILHWGRRRRRPSPGAGGLVRLHFLSQLLPEVFDFLHEQLTGGILNTRFYVFPFQRDVALSRAGAAAMVAQAARCRLEGGAVIMTPEARCSIRLKLHELAGGRGTNPEERLAAEPLAAFDALPHFEIFDESDEIMRVRAARASVQTRKTRSDAVCVTVAPVVFLRGGRRVVSELAWNFCVFFASAPLVAQTRFQLVYGCGEATPLPALKERFAAASAVLCALIEGAEDPKSEIADFLAQPGVAIAVLPQQRTGEAGSSGAGGSFFSEIRLLPGKALDSSLPSLQRELMKWLIQHPPPDLRWLREPPYTGREDALVKFATDASGAAADEIIPREDFALEEHREVLLALRGLLAYGTLAVSLRKRHRVDFGVSRLKLRRKRLAVPFRACDVPSERAEYSHPDTALVLTLLSYYYDGLGEREVKEALERLQKLDLSNQKKHFSRWLPSEPPDAVKSIDVGNAAQMRHYSEKLQLRTGIIDYWLLNCVLPTETVRLLLL